MGRMKTGTKVGASKGTFAEPNPALVRLNIEYFGSSCDERDELARQVVVDKLMAELPKLLEKAKESGEEVWRVVNITGVACNNSPVLRAIKWIGFMGKEPLTPKDREHLNSAAYKQLWGHLESLNLNPFIDSREIRLANGESLSYYYIAVPCPKAVPLRFGKIRVD